MHLTWYATDTVAKIRARVKLSRAKTPNAKVIVWLNAGLHEVNTDVCFRSRLCVGDVCNKSCVEAYKESLKHLITATVATEPDLIVYRTTTAGWSKWGNWGFTWPNTEQAFVTGHHFIRSYNLAAREILAGFPQIKIIDGFDMTLPRPDHTERSLEHEPGPHLVHPGPQIVELQQTIFKTLIMEQFCPSLLHRIQDQIDCTNASSNIGSGAQCEAELV